VKGAPESDAEALLQILAGVPPSARQQLLADRAAELPFGASPVQLVDVHPRTPDGRIDLCPDWLDRQAPAGLYGFQADPASDIHPLTLISPASDQTISSSLGELRRRAATLEMHPDDARMRGIENEDTVRIFNDRGQMECEVNVTEAVRPGTVAAPKGLWRADTLNGGTTNALAPDDLTDVGAGACFNDSRVQVAKVLEAEWENHALSLTVRMVSGGPDTTVH
jgi:anaerobic selenocysteine-containing dehydrogenase